MQEMQDALTSSEEERNALKRQLAKLSKKYQQVRGGSEPATAGRLVLACTALGSVWVWVLLGSSRGACARRSGALWQPLQAV
jgi:hypothetical protein